MKRRRRNRWLSFILAVVLVFTVTWPTVCHAVSPGESGEGSGNSEPFIRLGDLLQQQDDKPGQLHVNTILKEAFSPESAGSAWKLLNEKKVVFVSAETAAAQAIRKNLFIKVSQDDSEAAKEAILEAEAVFDPVLRFSISYSESDTYERGPKEVKVITRNWGTPATTIPPDPNKTDPQIIELGWIQQAGGEETTREFNASEDQENGATKTTRYTIGISQQLPWVWRIRACPMLRNRRWPSCRPVRLSSARVSASQELGSRYSACLLGARRCATTIFLCSQCRGRTRSLLLQGVQRLFQNQQSGVRLLRGNAQAQPPE